MSNQCPDNFKYMMFAIDYFYHYKQRFEEASNKLWDIHYTCEYVACCDGDFQCLNLLNDANEAMADFYRYCDDYRRYYGDLKEYFSDLPQEFIERLPYPYDSVEKAIQSQTNRVQEAMKKISEYYTESSPIQQQRSFPGKKAPVKRGWFS